VVPLHIYFTRYPIYTVARRLASIGVNAANNSGMKARFGGLLGSPFRYSPSAVRLNENSLLHTAARTFETLGNVKSWLETTG
jgi:hypothetical protein